ncbi:MAG: glucose-6-phosphate isomerase [Bacteriovoracia bacterium]
MKPPNSSPLKGIIHLELEQLTGPIASKDTVWKILELFLMDMDSDKSSFFHLPEKSNWAEELRTLQPELVKRIPKVSQIVHLGIGGSSLGTETIVKALAPVNSPDIYFVDNIDPDALGDLIERLEKRPQALTSTLFYVVTKSGTTMETMAQFVILFRFVEKKLGLEEAKNRFIFCTDSEKGTLLDLAKEWSTPTFSIPRNLGGRYSALSAVGLLPALVCGIDCNQILKGAFDYRANFLEIVGSNNIPPILDLAYRLAKQYTEHGRNITVLMPYSQKLKVLSAWFTQLWAESLGKNNKGMTPVSAVGATDQHSILQLLRDGPQDKVTGFVEVAGFQRILDIKWETFWASKKLPAIDLVSGITLNQLMDAEFNATREVLSRQKKPNFTIRIQKLSAHTLGQLLFCLETLTALTAYFLEIDPFDQPGVEEGKVLTQDRIRACKKVTN